MASPIRPDDWERLFAVDAPRRGGPLSALITMLVICTALGLVLGAAAYYFAVRDASDRRAFATATAFALNVAPGLTATAGAPTPTPVPSATAVVTPTIGVASRAILRGGNLRSEPRVADETAIGLLWPGDSIQVIEQRDVDGLVWFRVRVVGIAPDRPQPGAEVGTEGWVAALLFTAP